MARAALVIVDFQNDFLPGGKLAVPGGDEVVAILNEYVERFRRAELPVIATRDWHPPRTTHFKAFGGVWPEHCVQGTPGAEFHPELRLPETTVVVSKGMGEREDAYSGFQGRDERGTPLGEVLRARGIDHVFVGGVATDYCVRATVLDARQQGFRATALLDAMRGINLQPGDIERAIADMVRAGAEVAVLETLRLEALTAAEELSAAADRTRLGS